MELHNKTGWRASPPSPKDKLYPLSSIGMANEVIPPAASMEQWVSRIDDQQSKPWCVAFGTCNAIEFQRKAKGLPIPAGGFSKAWLYARCKQLDGIPGEDGTFVKTALWVALNEGLCPDRLLPTADWLDRDELPELTESMAQAAAQYKIKGFSKLVDPLGYASLWQTKQAISNGGMVIIASLVEMDNWMDADSLILVPRGEVLGGHCTYKCGYDDTKQYSQYVGFNRGVNSWGTSWGDGGKYDMAYAYDGWRDSNDGTPALLEAWAVNVGEAVKPCGIVCQLLKWIRGVMLWRTP